MPFIFVHQCSITFKRDRVKLEKKRNFRYCNNALIIIIYVAINWKYMFRFCKFSFFSFFSASFPVLYKLKMTWKSTSLCFSKNKIGISTVSRAFLGKQHHYNHNHFPQILRYRLLKISFARNDKVNVIMITTMIKHINLRLQLILHPSRMATTLLQYYDFFLHFFKSNIHASIQ